MFQLIKISFRQIFTKSAKSKNTFILCFGVISLAICLTALTVTLSLSQGFDLLRDNNYTLDPLLSISLVSF